MAIDQKVSGGKLPTWHTFLAVCLAILVPLAAMAQEARTDEQDDEESEEIVITAPRMNSEDESAASMPIGGEELRESPRPSLLEAISQEAPWIYVSSRGIGLHGIASGASGSIKMRGLGGSPNTQVLVVLDGVPDYQGIFGHPLPDAYVPELIEEVRVITGGDSVLYGTNAMGGVISMKNRWRTFQGSEFHLRAGVGSFQSLSVQPAVLGRWGDWDFAASFHGRASDGHRPGAGGELEVGHVACRYWMTESSRLTGWVKLAHFKGADPGPVTHPHPDHWFEALRLNSSVLFEHFQEDMRWRAMAFASAGRHTLYDGFHSLDIVTGASLENRWKLGRRLELLLGLAFDHTDGDVENRIQDESENVEGLTTLALYQQATWRPLDVLSLVAGMREVESLEYGFIFLYKAGVAVEAWKNGKLRARYVTNFRQPTIRERFLPYPVANPGLEPEYSRSFDVGIVQKIDEWFHGELNYFRTEADNLIKYFGSWPSATVFNIDHVVFPGVEGQIRLSGLGPFGFMLGGTYLHVGRYTKQNPSLKLGGRIDFHYRSLDVSLSGEWVHGLYQNNYSRDPLDDVFFIDLYLRYEFEKDAFAVYINARNLTDNRYAYIDKYPMPGINIFSGVEVHL